ncbi:hypothetical protein IFM89_017400 [Coptis chinensis]|uniref:Transposase-associated domain-containing protein n=1 Tax=Coptis chinensis TaxID=261450 RepID=A0A835HKV2_9MAGN|nr:hypothetical protein IFM89_017400 [Coptis chinensis]
MSSTSPSKAWMKEIRPQTKYLAGVESFMKFAEGNSGGVDWYLCPCVNCHNVGDGKTYEVMREHLICEGIMPSYTTWYCHGEPLKPIEANPERYKAFVNGENQGSVSGQTQGEQPRMPDLVNDTFGHIHLEDLDA